MSAKIFVLKCAVAAGAVIILLLVIDLGLRGIRTARRMAGKWRPPLYIKVESPVLYGLNPRHHEINSLGMRDDEVSLEKPEGVYRILVLGDSVAYGPGVTKEATFAKRLQAILRKEYPRLEVLNAGVSGYSAYSELQAYLVQGRALKPDLVMVAFCMNDVVNPRLHWDWTREAIAAIPDAAIPNHEYDKTHILPIVEELKKQKGVQAAPRFSLAAFFRASPLYRLVKGRIHALNVKRGATRDLQTAALPDVKTNLPTYLTTEDSIGIGVLMEDASPEWQWLIHIYAQLNTAVEHDGARLVIALFPLAYQLDEKYPFLPQRRLAAYGEAHAINTLDLLPVFRPQAPEKIFQLQNNKDGYYDIWHLTADGHRITAETVAAFLKDKGLLPAGK